MNEITLYQKFTNPLEAIAQLGIFFSKSGMFGCDKQEQGQVLAMACLSENKSPLEIIREYDIIGGKLRRKSSSALAKFRARGGKHKWITALDNNVEAIGEFAFEGNTLTSKFTIADAKRQGLVRAGSGWEKVPSNMLRARAASNAVGALCPEVYSEDDEDTVAGPSLVLSGATPEPAATITVTAPQPPASATETPVVILEAEIVKDPPTPVQERKPAPPDNVVDLAARGLAPVVPAVYPQDSKSPGKLTAATLEAFAQIMGDKAAIILPRLEAQGWYRGGDLSSISLGRMQRVFAEPANFIANFTK